MPFIKPIYTFKSVIRISKYAADCLIVVMYYRIGLTVIIQRSLGLCIQTVILHTFQLLDTKNLCNKSH